MQIERRNLLKKWTKEEDAILVQYYNNHGFAKTAHFMTWRSPMSLRSRIKALGLSDPMYSNPAIKLAYATWIDHQTLFKTFELFLLKVGLPPRGKKTYFNPENQLWEEVHD